MAMRASTCISCKTPIDTRKEGVPSSYLIMIDSGADVPMICRACVERLGLNVERLTDKQDRIWLDGEKFLSYGDVFVQMNPSF